MLIKPSKFTTGAALIAAFSMTAAPAAAAELPYVGPSHVGAIQHDVETGAAEDQAHHHRWRHRRHRDRGVDAGDVIAGVLVLGAIAAIVGSGNDDRDRNRNRDRDYRERNDRDDRNERRDYESNGIERAADMCVEQIERGDDRVEDVSSASRAADGWRIAGTLEGGDGWNCWIDNDGRIRNVEIGSDDFTYDPSLNTGSAAPAGDQWSDDAYARARSNTRTATDGEYAYREAPRVTPETEGPQPAYPGGPLPGEEGYAEAMASAGDDNTYTSAQLGE